MDSFIEPSNNRIEAREGIELLLKHYEKTSQQSEQLRLLKKLILLDSISNFQDKNLSIDFVKQKDTDQLKTIRDNLNAKLEKKEETFISIIIAIGVILLFSYFYFIRSRKKEKILLEKVNKKTPEVKKEIEIPSKIVNDLIQKLKEFEEKKKYASNNISLSGIAKSFNTNSTYLSKVINTETGKNFTNYINDLRINYIESELKNKPKFRLYSNVALAEECGFNNVKSFSRAFARKNNMSPVQFIKEL